MHESSSISNLFPQWINLMSLALIVRLAPEEAAAAVLWGVEVFSVFTKELFEAPSTILVKFSGAAVGRSTSVSVHSSSYCHILFSFLYAASFVFFILSSLLSSFLLCSFLLSSFLLSYSWYALLFPFMLSSSLFFMLLVSCWVHACVSVQRTLLIQVIYFFCSFILFLFNSILYLISFIVALERI